MEITAQDSKRHKKVVVCVCEIHTPKYKCMYSARGPYSQNPRGGKFDKDITE